VCEQQTKTQFQVCSVFVFVTETSILLITLTFGESVFLTGE